MVFIHPVCDQGVVEGNSTMGMEIGHWLQQQEKSTGKTAVFVAYGGGGCSIGLSCGLRNSGTEDCDVIAIEPQTAAPFAASVAKGEMTPVVYKPSFCDGCGGKAVLPNMWQLAREATTQPLLSSGVAVTLKQIESAVACMFDQHKIVAEGAGACGLAAAMFSPKALEYDRIVAVVCGGCIDTKVLFRILNDVESSPSTYSNVFIIKKLPF